MLDRCAFKDVLKLCLLLPALATPALAADVTAVKAGLLIDGNGGDPVRNATVLVEGDRITAAGADVKVPKDAEVIDLSAYTLLPGFIDAHVHLVGRTIGEGDWQNSRVRDLPQLDAIRGVRNARLTLEAGFTTVRNVGARDFSDIALRDAINEGVIEGPRILAAGHSLGATGSHCDTNGFIPGVAERGPEQGIADSPSLIAQAIRHQIKRGADVVKFCATGGVLSEGDEVGITQYTFAEMQLVVRYAKLAGRKVAAHAHGSQAANSGSPSTDNRPSATAVSTVVRP